MLSGVWKSNEGRSEEEEDEERSVRGKRKPNEDLEEAENRRKRGSYKCSKCGQPKKGHVCLEPPHQSTVLPSTPSFEGTSLPSPQAYPSNPSYEYPQNLVPPAPPDQNTAHLMTVIAQLESQIKMLHRENLQLRSHLSRWYELANLGEIPPPYGPPSSRPDKPSPDLPFKRYDSQDYTLNPSSPHNNSPENSTQLPHSATLPSPNLSPGLLSGLLPPPGLVPEFRGSPNGGYEGASLGHRYGPKHQHPGITQTKSTYPADGSFDADVDGDTEGDIEGEGEGEDVENIGGMVVRNYQLSGTGLRENGKS